MTELDRLIRSMIEAEGPMPIARFMQLALQHPEHGYYVKGDPLGVDGDFTTAPEVSQLFGETIGLWLADTWRRSCKPSPFALLELGPGRGTLMRDALRVCDRVLGFPQAMKLHLMESNTTLRQKQAETLGAYNPFYLEDLSDLPEMPLFVIANEFFDALPVYQYINTEAGWRERLVGLEGDKLVFVQSKKKVPMPLPEELPFFEMSMQAIAIVQLLSAHIAKHGGGILIIDYGTTQGGQGDTLQAVSGHASVPVLEAAGQVDLTAHVDFAALAQVARRQGAFVPDVTAQGPFLQALGIEIRAAQLKLKATPEQAKAIDEAVARLLDPDQMGSLFKVMAIVPEGQNEVCGFT